LNRQWARATAQVDRRIEIEERQREHRRRRHAVRQQPEEDVLVAGEAVAREGVGGRQREADRQHRVDDDVGQRVDVAGIPGFVGEDADVVVERRLLRQERQAAGDLEVRLEAHVDEPVDRHEQEQQVEREDDARASHDAGLRSSASTVVITV
jgi:hypothetical protein